MGRRYTELEDRFIRENYKTMTDNQIAEELGRNGNAIKLRRALLGLTKYDKSSYWSDEEITILKEIYSNIPIEFIGKKINKDASQIKYKVEELNLGNRYIRNCEWNDRELGILREHIDKMGVPKIAFLLSRDKKDVKSKAKELGLYSVREFSEKEVEYIRKNIDKKSIQEMCKELEGVSYKGLVNKIKYMGLKSKFIRGVKSLSDKDKRFIVDNYDTMDVKDISEKLNININRLYKEANKLGLTKDDREWSNAEIVFLCSLYGNRNNKYISRLLKRKMSAIEIKVKELGLK